MNAATTHSFTINGVHTCTFDPSGKRWVALYTCQYWIISKLDIRLNACMQANPHEQIYSPQFVVIENLSQQCHYSREFFRHSIYTRHFVWINTTMKVKIVLSNSKHLKDTPYNDFGTDIGDGNARLFLHRFWLLKEHSPTWSHHGNDSG